METEGHAATLGASGCYWNARDPRRCLAPDAFVKTGVADSSLGSWKTWQNGGAPELAVEIIGPNEGDGVSWEDKLTRYHGARRRGARTLRPGGARGHAASGVGPRGLAPDR